MNQEPAIFELINYSCFHVFILFSRLKKHLYGGRRENCSSAMPVKLSKQNQKRQKYYSGYDILKKTNGEKENRRLFLYYKICQSGQITHKKNLIC